MKDANIVLALVCLVGAVNWMFGAVLAGVVAEAKGRSVVGWTLGALFLFSPLLGLIALAALPRRSKPKDESERSWRRTAGSAVL